MKAHAEANGPAETSSLSRVVGVAESSVGEICGVGDFAGGGCEGAGPDIRVGVDAGVGAGGGTGEGVGVGVGDGVNSVGVETGGDWGSKHRF